MIVRISRLLVLSSFGFIVACGDRSQSLTLNPNPVTKSRLSAAAPVPDNVRFGVQGPGGVMPGGAAPGAQAGLAFAKPEGWTQVASSEFRNPNFKLDGVPGAEAYVTVLGGGGGGVVQNLNRWRNQFGLAPLAQAEIDALPKMTVLGADATLVDWTGSFKGMGNTAQENFRIVGAMVALPERLVTVKMIGPKDGLDGELEHFRSFIGSLRAGGTPESNAATASTSETMTAQSTEMPAGHPPVSLDSGQDSGAADSPIGWTVPAGWSLGSPRQMRLASFKLDASDQIDVSLVMLSGTGGGTEANIQRWYDQMGQPKPTTEDISRLPVIEALGVKAPYVEISGKFSGMGRDALGDAALVAAIFDLGGQTLFVKMTGPKDAVLAQRETFKQFCLSLQRR